MKKKEYLRVSRAQYVKKRAFYINVRNSTDCDFIKTASKVNFYYYTAMCYGLVPYID